MFKLPGGAVVAHGSQQPDRKEEGLEEKSISASSQRVKENTQGEAVKTIGKGKQL